MTLPSLIAQSLPDISTVPSDQVKWFVMLAGWALVGWLLIRRSKAPSGGRDEPLHLGQPVEVKQAAEYASKGETAKAIQTLNQQMDNMARENLRQHNSAGDKIAKRLDEVLRAGADREQKLLKEFHEMELRIGKQVIEQAEKIHLRINPIEAQVSEHKGAISALKDKLASIWDQITGVRQAHAEDLRRLHVRMDDTIRASKRGKS